MELYTGVERKSDGVRRTTVVGDDGNFEMIGEKICESCNETFDTAGCL